ncbi:hypothetical protein [Mammaliicoccus lentus]|nr:hypothetical protein [Mammaliicoccus lentus]
MANNKEYKVVCYRKDGTEFNPNGFKVPDHIKQAVQVVLRKGGVK